MTEDRLVAGRYRLVRQLGRGGMGVVWQAHDERLDRTVAVKQLLLPAGLTGPEADEVKRLTVREGRIAARLQHPNLIMVYDVAEDGGQPYLIMEYLPSRSLSDVLADRGPLSPGEAARIGAQAAAALAAAHAAGVVHRDVKPGNVLLGDDGSVKITDFGISRAVEDVTTTATGMIAGTPAYLCPEVAKGQRATYSSDVFSLGSTLYAAVEGTPPFGTAENSMALLYRVASSQINPPRRSGPLTEVLVHMLRQDPQQRPTMAQATESLAAVADQAANGAAAQAVTQVTTTPAGVPTTAPLPPTPTPAPTPTPPRSTAVLGRTTATPPQPVHPVPPGSAGHDDRRRQLLATAALVAVLALAGLLWALWPDTEPNLQGGSQSSTQPTESAAQPGPTTSENVTSQSAQLPPATTTTTSASAPYTSTEPPAQPAGSPAQAITEYYGLMPGNTEAGWSRLSEKYQLSTPKTYANYQAFWSDMTAVQVSGVSPTGDTTVEATVVYSFKDGRTVEERHSYTLVAQDGRWLIDRSAVLSSRNR